ncbi:RasGAP protein [Coemansia sp. RSA 1933]|nr:RasGAP protein [Coemansia sp. RSA 1933]
MSKGLKHHKLEVHVDEMPAKMDKPEPVVELNGKQTHIKDTVSASRHSRKKKASTKEDTGSTDSAGLGGMLGRLWGSLRRGRDSSTQSRRSKTLLETGAAVVGPVRDPHTVIPADVLFSPRRAALYSNMVTLLIHNPYYLSRVIHSIKHYECDALLAIILDSVFSSQIHEAALMSLFSEIIELEVDRTSSIDTVMRNDAPSVHMLSAFLKRQSCLEYLRLAVGPTIETIVELGNVSLDAELASVYQDWARTQTPTKRLSLVVSAVEAASYTEVQNLSRRRQRYLSHIASHCLFDITSTRNRIPPGLLSICASTLEATRRKFPHADQAKAYSLVGGIFFLRFINAALTSPNHYGLLNDAPMGMVKANLKLVARLIQRLSNYSAKPPDEWPLDSRKFIKGNVNRFHEFLASLTSKGVAAGGDFALLDGSEENQVQRISTSPICDIDSIGVGVHRLKSMPKESRRHKVKEKSRVKLAREASTALRSISPLSNAAAAGAADQHNHIQLSLTEVISIKSFTTATTEAVGNQQQIDDNDEVSRDASPLVVVPKTSNAEATDTKYGTFLSPPITAGVSVDPLPPPPPPPNLPNNKQGADSNSSSNTTSREGSTTTESFSMHSMYNLGDTHSGKGVSSRRPSGAVGDCGSVTLPLNDLYLLQKYLAIYTDAWIPSEATNSRRLVLADDGHYQSTATEDDQTPMQQCLDQLEEPPQLVSMENNHRTRIFLTFCKQ